MKLCPGDAIEEHEEWVAPYDPWDADGNYDPSERLERYTCPTVIVADPNGIVEKSKDDDPPFFTDCWRFAAPSPRGTPGLKKWARVYEESEKGKNHDRPN